jgi:integrase
MARSIERLSDKQVRNAKPKGKLPDGSLRDSVMLCDGGNLYLQATLGKEGNVRRSWIFRYQRKGHPVRDMGLGSLNDVSLAEARDLAREYRGLVKRGIDPIERRNAEVAQNLAASARVMTFDEAGATYIHQHQATWKNPKHAAQWKNTLRDYASPTLGRLSVADITTEHVSKLLDPIWTVKPETASRVRGRVEAVLGWATVKKYRTGDNPARWRGHLDKLFPAKGKVRKVKHQAALAYSEMPDFMAELREQRKGMAALALEFAILTCVRTADVRKARWDHIDRSARMWTIPEFSKTHREHRVPLSKAAMAVLDKAEQIACDVGGAIQQSGFLFPNDVTGAALSENAMLAVLERMGRKGAMTTHGCRASFRTWAQERTSFAWELCEMSLGHVVGEKVERAYARGDALKKRYAIMETWAGFLAKPDKTGKVIPLQTRTA